MQWLSLIDQHVARLRSTDMTLWNKVDKYYLGEAWAETQAGASEAELLKTSTNFSFPIVETASAVLIPPNPQVTMKPRNPLNKEQIDTAEGVVNYSLDAGHYREELKSVVEHVVKYGRGPVKTTWDAENDLPVTRFINPRNYFYDMTAPRFSDIRYEIEATILSRRDMQMRVDSGEYQSSALEHEAAERYPQWLRPDSTAEVDRLRDYQPWYLVWEVHDRESGRVMHFLPQKHEPILDDELIFRPYDMLTFSRNGKDVGGVSEIGLILPNQEEYNWSDTFLLNVLRANIPATLYDARALTVNEAVKLSAAPLGSYFPLKVPSDLVGGINGVFASRPMPTYPVNANEMLARKREAISFISALSDAARGQTVGARTATELAFIEGNLKNRLKPRQDAVSELTERVAAKHLLLASRYMRKEKVVRLTGSTKWVTYSPWAIEGVTSDFKIVPYSPVESNRSVRVETLRNVQPLVVGNPWVKQQKFAVELFSMLDMPDMVYTEEEMRAQMAQQAAAAQGAVAPAPGDPPLLPPPDQGGGTAPSDLPPRAAGFSDSVSQPPPGSMP